MIDVRHEQTVAAPPAAVWKLLAQFDRIAEWSSAVDHSNYLTAREEGVGAGRRTQVGSMVLREEITVWEPEVRLAYALQGLPPIVKEVVNDWTIVPDGAGSIVGLTARITPGDRPPMKLAARVLARRVGATNAGLLADLARAAEGR